MSLEKFLASSAGQLRLVLILIACSFVLTACATPVDTIKQDKIKILDEDSGYLLMAINTNLSMKDIRITGPADTLLTADDLKQGSNYILFELPRGEYRIDRIRLLSLVSFRLKKGGDYWKFKVEPGTINYIGDLKAHYSGWFNDTGEFTLINRSSYALEFLENDFPNILENRVVTYSGPGNDGFLDFASSTLRSKSEVVAP